MTNEEMKSELTRLLELWNRSRPKYGNLKIDDLIIERMKGMIELAFHLKIISDAEKNELNYIYFDDDNAVEPITED